MANEMTGRVNTQYNKVEDYFTLKEENRRLHKFNDSLLNLLSRNFMRRDTGLQLVKDSLPFDTAGHYRRYFLRDAVVIYNTVNAPKNYIQLNRGSNQGIKDNMAVISSDGSAVGVVVNVSPNFCQVMSLLHVQSTVSASLKKSGDFGTVEWDGKDPRFLLLKKIPKSVEVKPGDTVLTSPYSYNIPPGYMVGTIADIKVDNTTGMYVLKIKTAANFYNLQQVHVIENIERDEQVKLFEETQKKDGRREKEPPMSDFLRNIIRLAVFILVQVYVLNKIPHLHRFITPYLYYLFILWLPFSISRMGLLVVGFITGLILDYFMMTPGLACGCLCTDRLCPSLCYQYSYPKRYRDSITGSLRPKLWGGRLIWYTFSFLPCFIMAIWFSWSGWILEISLILSLK